VTTTEDRLAAAGAVGRVLRSGAWSNVVSRTEAAVHGADTAAVQGLVFAVLRHRPMIDGVIERVASRPLRKIDKAVVDLLRVGTAELLADRTPAPLVVDGIVHAVRRISPRAAGFANAVMRAVASDPPTPTTAADIGIPPFVDAALRHVLPSEQVDELWAASQRPAPVGLRSTEPIDGATAVDGIPGAWLWEDGAAPPGIPVQDPASVAVGNTMRVRPGDGVLDMAAAPGGKTRHLLDRLGDTGMVVAMDSHPRRVRDASRAVAGARWLIGDGRAAPFAESSFDGVLVDAPCTGLGTLRRRPELRERVTPESMASLAVVQRAMLEEALRLVKPGGRVVYSVCTITPAETIDVVAGLGGVAPSGLPGTAYGDGWLLAPHLGPTDGMFISVFDR
jgi:16S rRNA (cytosine967-C5)-methyltransferase